MQATPSEVKVTFLCGKIVLFSGLIPMLPQEGDSVNLGGIEGYVQRMTLTYTQEEGMSVVAHVCKVR